MPATTTRNGVSLNYDTFGDPDHPAMVLIQGLGAHMLGWHEDLCGLLADRGYHVVRFDNRDVGLSQNFRAGATPSPTWPTTPSACSTPWTSTPRTSSGSQWAE